MRFSIVTITKNDPVGLVETKKSIYAQTYIDYEWIVIDGDKEPDNGIYDAMNKGLVRARGRYVIFMNSGDVFANDGVLANVAQYDADFIYGDSVENGCIKYSKHISDIKYGMITHHQAMVYRAEILKKLQYDEQYKVAADYNLTLQFINLSYCILYINHVFCIYSVGGYSHINSVQGRIEQDAIRKKFGIYSPFISLRQWIAEKLRNYFPSLYLKFRMIT